MSSEQNDGGPAFPLNEKSDDGSHHYTHSGMSLRDWFAGQALTACSEIGESGPTDWHVQRAKNMAEVAYIYADAMIAERAKAGHHE